MGVYVYVDGFNFDYRLFKNNKRKHPLPAWFKWLDIKKLSQQLAPAEEIEWIGYFTAYLRESAHDPGQHIRQRAYLEALRSIDCLEIISGNLLPVQRTGPVHRSGSSQRVTIKTFEEKGSDVNLASRLVWDGARSAFSKALVVTNDTDLREPIRIVVQEIGLPVEVYSPCVNVNYDLHGWQLWPRRLTSRS
jgi:hypothetical protein